MIRRRSSAIKSASLSANKSGERERKEKYFPININRYCVARLCVGLLKYLRKGSHESREQHHILKMYHFEIFIRHSCVCM